jgi:hypothetical protein
MAKRVQRMGRWIDADESFEAWISGDLHRMIAARSTRTNPIDRHFLLQGIVKAAYKLRRDPVMRQLCIETGLMHLDEFATLAPALRADFDGQLPQVPSFAWLATVLAEEGQLDEAVRVCHVAAQLGVEDGTHAGYRGRAQRFARKKPPGAGDT